MLFSVIKNYYYYLGFIYAFLFKCASFKCSAIIHNCNPTTNNNNNNNFY